MKYLLLITCISIGVTLRYWLRNNKKDHFIIRLKAWLAGDSLDYPNALIEWSSDFEMIRRSRKGNVIPFPTKNKHDTETYRNLILSVLRDFLLMTKKLNELKQKIRYVIIDL